MELFAAEHSDPEERLILIGCTDDYANLIARNRGKLEPDELEIEIAVDTYKLDELQLEEG